jgi:DNA-binding transcriptional ArsR family regulator
MRERDYRESRICRTLGNPTAFQILDLLEDGSRRRPTDIARAVGRGLPAVSMTLRLLRVADLLRYEHRGRDTRYWLKYPDEARALLAALRRLVTRTSRRIRKDR